MLILSQYTIINNHNIYCLFLSNRIKYVPLKMSDLVKYGVEQAQIEQIKRGVYYCVAFLNKFIIEFQSMLLILVQEVDFTPLALSMNYRFYLLADLSVPLMIAPFHMAVPWPETESRLLAPIRPFQSMVESFLCVCVISLK